MSIRSGAGLAGSVGRQPPRRGNILHISRMKIQQMLHAEIASTLPLPWLSAPERPSSLLPNVHNDAAVAEKNSQGRLCAITMTSLDLATTTGSGFSNKKHMNKPCCVH